MCVCVCTVWGGRTASDQKQSALVQSVSVPTFTHKRQGTQVCHSAQTYTYIHTHTHTHTYTHLSHTKHTNPPSSRHPARPLTIGQVPEPSASPSRLKGPFGKAGDRGKRSWCYLSRWLSGSLVQGEWLDLPLQKTLQFRVCIEATLANWLVVQLLYFHSGICFGGSAGY